MKSTQKELDRSKKYRDTHQEQRKAYFRKYYEEHKENNKEKLQLYLLNYDPSNDNRVQKCNKCGETKPILDFYHKARLTSDNILEYRPTCKKCSHIYDLKRREKHRETIRKSGRRANAKRAWNAMCRIAPDGDPKCMVCGFKADKRLLQIDHINNDGNIGMKNYNGRLIRPTISKLITEIMEMPIDELRLKYQILCVAHNWIKRYKIKGEEYALIKKD